MNDTALVNAPSSDVDTSDHAESFAPSAEMLREYGEWLAETDQRGMDLDAETPGDVLDAEAPEDDIPFDAWPEWAQADRWTLSVAGGRAGPAPDGCRP